MRTNYLLEDDLYIFCQERFDGEMIRDKKVFKEYNFRPDIFLKNHNLILEFNGPRHYTDNKQIILDYKKRIACNKMGIDLIEVPYFIQFDSTIVSYLFCNYNIDKSAYNNYEHGFISKKAILPDDYCFNGLLRLVKDIKTFDCICDNCIFNTIKSRLPSEKELLSFLQTKLNQ